MIPHRSDQCIHIFARTQSKFCELNLTFITLHTAHSLILFKILLYFQKLEGWSQHTMFYLLLDPYQHNSVHTAMLYYFHNHSLHSHMCKMYVVHTNTNCAAKPTLPA
jgi:hypothetical protein